MKLRIFPLVLTLLMLLTLCACQNGSGNAAVTTNPTSDQGDPSPVKVNVYSLNGTTGFGMAKLMNDAKSNAFPNIDYQFTVKSDASDVTAALINGEADIAALPTNAASNVYNATKGEVVILAVNTRGCLYLLTNGNASVSSFADLRGKTVYVPAQNPTFIFTYLCQQNGLEVGKDIIIDSTSYAAAANLKDAVAAGKVDIAVLPEPMVTIATNAAKQNNVTITNAMDLTAEWDKVTTPGSLVQGCIVARKAFVQNYPETVSAFLTAYEASINYLSTNVEEAAQMIVDNGIFNSAPVAKNAIPKCNICYLDGAEMKAAMEVYLNILYNIKAASVGGKLPAADFYYNAQ